MFTFFSKADVSNRKMKRVNMESQEIYLDLVCKKKAMSSKEMKNLYRLFSENGENEIHFRQSCLHEKSAITNKFRHNQGALSRIYIRIFEKTIRKIVYFWRNNSYLKFLSESSLALLKLT